MWLKLEAENLPIITGKLEKKKLLFPLPLYAGEPGQLN
jgi:hypothetical protein